MQGKEPLCCINLGKAGGLELQSIAWKGYCSRACDLSSLDGMNLGKNQEEGKMWGNSRGGEEVGVWGFFVRIVALSDWS